MAPLLSPLMAPEPLVAPALPLLLQRTLPGVDPNDLMKTMQTLIFYYSFLTNTPLLHSSGSATRVAGVTPAAQVGLLLNVDAVLSQNTTSGDSMEEGSLSSLGVWDIHHRMSQPRRSTEFVAYDHEVRYSPFKPALFVALFIGVLLAHLVLLGS